MDPVNSASMENADGKAADELLFLMNLSKKDGIQRIQSEHRLRLVRLWGVGRGERILEIGCGQGDTTAALAYCTGPEGFVWGIDPAGENYGAPETLGMARDRLLSGPLAGRLRMDFGFDLVRDFDCLRGEAFDRVVLSHSLWYMDSYETLSEILKTCRRIGKKLSIAEWDPIAAEPEQAAHARAAFLQAVCGCFRRPMSVRFSCRMRSQRRCVSPAGMWKGTGFCLPGSFRMAYGRRRMRARFVLG